MAMRLSLSLVGLAARSASARLPGLIAGSGGEFGRQRVGGISGNVERRERDAGHAEFGLAARAVDQAGRADDAAWMLGDRRQAFARRQAGGDDVLDHQHARAGRDGEAAPQREDAVLALDENRLGPEPARRLVAGHDAAERRRNDDVDFAKGGLGLARPARGTGFRVRAGSWKMNIFCRKIGECRPEERMKCPSSSAPAARNSCERLFGREVEGSASMAPT